MVIGVGVRGVVCKLTDFDLVVLTAAVRLHRTNAALSVSPSTLKLELVHGFSHFEVARFNTPSPLKL